MDKYIKICPNCNYDNSAIQDVCVCGQKLDFIIPTKRLMTETKSNIETELQGVRFRQCKTCNTKNYLENNKDIRICKNCGNDELYKSKIMTTSIQAETKIEVETECQTINEMKLIDKAKQQVLNIPENGAVLGRMGSVHADFFTDYEYVGRTHCEIIKENNIWYVIDLSSNGTQINGNLITKNEKTQLNNGDLFSLANAHFKVEFS